MLDVLNHLFAATTYMPHGHCYLWQTPLLWLHILSDGFITLAYYSIPLMLLYFIRQRVDVPFRSIFWLFSAFILTCGTTHAMEIWTLWHPSYWLSGSLKAFTALVSCYTAVALAPVIPAALSMPSSAQLEEANAALRAEIEERKRIEAELEYRLEFDRLVAKLSTQFIHLDSEALSAGINEALEELAEFMEVEHSYIFQLSSDLTIASFTHAWLSPRLPAIEGSFDIACTDFPWSTSQLLQGHILCVPSVASLTPEAARDQQGWQAHQLKSLLCIPLSIQEQTFGWVGFATYTHEQDWSDNSVQLLKIFGEMLANTLNREQVEAERQAAQKQLQTVFSETPSLTAIAGFDGYFKLLSPRFETLLGYSQTELLSQPFLSFVHPDDRSLTTAEAEKLATGGKTIGFENRYRCQDGRYRWIAWYCASIPAEQLIYATAVDITERKQEQFALTKQNQGLQLLAALTLDIRQSRQIDDVLQITVTRLQEILRVDRVLVLEINIDGCIARAESVLPGQSQIVGEQFLDPCFAKDYTEKYRDGSPSIMVDVSQAKIQDCHRELLERLNVKANVIAPIIIQEQIWGLVVAHQCDSPREWTNLEVDLLKQVADQISVGLSQWTFLNQLEQLVRDRTAALAKSQNQFRSLFEAAPDLIYVLNTEGKIQKVNPAVIDILGYEEIELQDRPLPELLTPQYKSNCMQNFAQLRKDGFHRQEMQLQCKDKSRIMVDCSCTVVTSDDDPYILVLQRDISDQKAIESMKNEFVSVVSHELRTPLTSIHGSIKLLSTGQLGSLSSQGEQVLDIALRNTDRLSRLINDVLDLERIESGKVIMSKQRCHVTDLLTQAAQEMQAMAAAQKVMLSTQPLGLDIYADPDHIMQTLTNLLSNAIKFSAELGRVELSAFEQGNEILFEVRDQGRGIPKDKLEVIFERFQQVDASDARHKGGTGLGLPICRQIVARHGGRIWAESVDGQGSSIYFTLPKFESVKSISLT